MYDVLVIGSGPAGLSAAVYAKRANLKVAVIEKEYEGTGQIAESQKVDNYLGFPGITGYDLGEKFREHALNAGVEFIEQEVTKIKQTITCSEEEEHINAWKLLGDSGCFQLAKTIIYAAGAKARTLNVEGEAQLIGKGISFCAICDGAFYKDKAVAVIGGGDTALDDALYLSDIAKKVYLVHRREGFRGAEATLEALKKRKNVELILNAQVKEFLGEEKLSGLKLQTSEKQPKEIAVSGAFIAIGSDPATLLLKDLVDFDEQGYILAKEDGVTSAAGIFAAGDVRTKGLRQVVTAVSDGANAATSASEYIKKL